MKLAVLLLFFLLVVQNTISQTTCIEPYFGKYKGILNISSGHSVQKINMEFHLLPTQNAHTFEYNIIYINNDSVRDERYYTLRFDTLSQKFSIDENNGIILSALWVENSLYSLFEIQGGILTSKIEFNDSYLDFEITHSSKKNALMTGDISDDIPKVISYPIGNVQKAKLFKVSF